MLTVALGRLKNLSMSACGTLRVRIICRFNSWLQKSETGSVNSSMNSSINSTCEQ